MASLVFWVWKHKYRSEVAGITLGLLVLFHTGTGITTGIAVGDGDPIAAPFIHALIAVACVTLFVSSKKWYELQRGPNGS
jgi:hypothetical protein